MKQPRNNRIELIDGRLRILNAEGEAVFTGEIVPGTEHWGMARLTPVEGQTSHQVIGSVGKGGVAIGMVVDLGE